MSAPPCDKIQAAPKQLVFPTHAYLHSAGRVAIIGGDYYTGTSFPANYQGGYFFGDYNTGEIWVMTMAGNTVQVEPFASQFAGLVQISPGPDGTLYVLTARGGTLYRVRWQG